MDSGTTDHDLQQLSMSSGDATANIPGELFEILKKIGSTVLMAESFHHGVVVHFVALLERCASKEAFSAPQKQHFSAWIQRLKTVWNPTMRKSLNNKNKYVNYARRSVNQYVGYATTLTEPYGEWISQEGRACRAALWPR